MKKSTRVLSLLLSIVMVLGMLPVTSLAADSTGLDNFKKVNSYSEAAFTDVSILDWFYENIVSVFEYGLMIGKENNLFDTEGNVTIAETMTIAARLHSIYYTGKADFEQTEPWYAVYADYCKANGIADPAAYDLTTTATRAQFAEILANAMPDEAWEIISKIADGAIPDVKLTDRCAAAVYKLYRAGVLVGNDDKGTFAPDSNIRRKEVAAIVTRMAIAALRKAITLGDVAVEKPVKETAEKPNTPKPMPLPFPVHMPGEDTYYTVTFVVDNSTYASFNVKQGAVVDQPSDPIIDGYSFLYWYDSCGNRFDFDEEIENDLTLYGKMMPHVYTDEETLELLNGFYGVITEEFSTNFEPFDEIEVEYTLSDVGSVSISQKLSSPFMDLPGLVGSVLQINHFGGNVISANIIFHYNPELLGTISPEDLAIFYYDENSNIVVLEDTIVDTDMCTISVSTNHLSLWGVINKKIWNDVQEMLFPTIRTEKSPYYNIILALDNSGSMDRGTKMNDCINVANNFIDVLSNDDIITLISFGDIPEVHLPQSKLMQMDEFGNLVDNRSQIKKIISSLYATGGTDIDMTLKIADSYFTNDQNYHNILILVSDGQSSVHSSTLSKIEQSGATVLTVGIGSDVDTILMENIASSTGGSYIPCEDTSELQNAFIKLQNIYIGSSIDTDCDGLPDIVESTGMRDQFGVIYKTDPNNPDSDNDGIMDGEEMGTYHSGNRPYFERKSRPDLKTEIVDDCLINNCNLEYIEPTENNTKLHLCLSSTCSLYRVYPDVATPYEELAGLGDLEPIEYIYQVPKYCECEIKVFRPDGTTMTTIHEMPIIVYQDMFSATYQHDISVEYANNTADDISYNVKSVEVSVVCSTTGEKWQTLNKTILFDNTIESVDEYGNNIVMNPVKIYIERNAELAFEKQKLEVVSRWNDQKKELACNIVKKALDGAKQEDILNDSIEEIKKLIEEKPGIGWKKGDVVPNAIYKEFAVAVYEAVSEGTIDKLEPLKPPYNMASLSDSFFGQIQRGIRKGIKGYQSSYTENGITYRLDLTILSEWGVHTDWCYVYENGRHTYTLTCSNVFEKSGEQAIADFLAKLNQLNTDSWKEFEEEYVLAFFKGLGSNIKKENIDKVFGMAEEIILATSSKENAKKFIDKYFEKAADELMKRSKKYLEKFIENFVPNGNVLLECVKYYQNIEKNIKKIQNATESDDILDLAHGIEDNISCINEILNK